jgi:hypothetical protein
MSDKAFDTNAQDFDRQVARSAAALRVLAYAMFIGAIVMALANQSSYNEMFGGVDDVSLQVRVSQFVSRVIPYLTLAAVVLATSALIQIALERVRVTRQASFPAQKDRGPARRMAVDDEMWRQPSASAEGG